MSDFANPKVMLSAEQIQVRVQEMANDIVAQSEGEPVLLVGVLKGSMYFLSDLSRAMPNADVQIDFIQVSSYHGQKSSSGVVQIRKDLDINVEGRIVWVVEDIVDTGITLSYLRSMLETRSPKALKVVALLSKPAARQLNVQVELVGFEISNQFVVGYGLDYGERFRNLPYIAILGEE